MDAVGVVCEFDPLHRGHEALLRRARIASSKKLTVGGLTLDAADHTAYLNGEEITKDYVVPVEIVTSENVADYVGFN